MRADEDAHEARLAGIRYNHRMWQLISARVSVQTLTEHALNRKCRASAGLGALPRLPREGAPAEARGQAMRLPSIRFEYKVRSHQKSTFQFCILRATPIQQSNLLHRKEFPSGLSPTGLLHPSSLLTWRLSPPFDGTDRGIPGAQRYVALAGAACPRSVQRPAGRGLSNAERQLQTSMASPWMSAGTPGPTALFKFLAASVQST